MNLELLPVRMIFSLAVSLAIGCGTTRSMPYQPKPVGSYPRVVTAGDIAVAAYPVTRAEIERHLAPGLLEARILPVFVGIENHSRDRSFFVLTDAIRVDDGRLSEPAPGSATAGKVLATIGGVSILAAPVLFPLLPIGSQMVLQKKEHTRSIRTQALYNHTVSPGETEGGFLYVPIPEGAARPWVLHLEVIDASDLSTHPIDVPIEWDASKS